MSTTVDERVVEMRFDNKNFESNVATSMSTLEKLKHSLRLDGAAKGLQNLSSAAKNNNLDALGNSANTVGLRFNAMYTMADQALRNITTRVQHTAESMIKALTLDPITTGFREYETQMNAVQTILANTSSKGSTIQDVNAALKELNDYADLTIYNFTEMTRNIGTFTAAGIDLDTSVNAIQGIANLAAVSGSTSQQASTAMYQLSQALASGTVKLMDWNSVVNAGMGGEVFQNALKETSRLLGTGADAAIEAAGSFRESLSQGWLTSEVLTTTLRKFTTSGAAEYVAEYTGLTNEAVDAILESTDAWGDQADAVDKASEALAEQSGKSKDEIKAILDMAKTAQDAATKVKTFTQLWDVLKEAAQSGWAQTWQLIIGDFEEAKALLSPLADFFTGIIGSISDLRNNILRSALGKTFVNLTENVSGMFKPVEKTVEAISNVTNSLKDLDEIANRVIRGDFGNGQERFNALTESGQNCYEVQNRVNEMLGDSYRYTQKQIDMQNQLLGTQRATTTATEDSTEAISDSEEATVALTEAQKDQIKSLLNLSDEELRAQGYTDEQIASLDELRATYEKLGIPMEDFIDNIEEINGRWLLINSFKNIGQGLIGIFNSLKTAWQDVFPPKSIEERAEGLFNIIAGFHKLTSTFANAIYANGKLTETGENLAKTFKGLFAILDLVRTVVGGGLSIAFKVLSTVLGAFNLDILDVTASIGDALVSFRDWVLKENAVAKAIDELVGKLPDLIDEFKAWFDTFKQTPAVQKLITAIEAIQSAFDKLMNGEIDINEFASSLGENLALALKSLPEIAIQVGKDFIAGFQNGIDFSVSDVIDKIISFCTNFINSFKEALGVHSPSWKAFEIIVDFFRGVINGALSMLEPVISVLKTIGEQIVKVFKSFWDFITDESGNIEWDKILASGLVASMLWVLKTVASAFSGIANAFGGFEDIIVGVGKTLKGFGRVLNGIAWDLKAKAMLKMAIAIAILVAAIWVLTTIDDPAKLWQAVGIIAVLAAVLVGLSVAMNKLSSASLDVDASSKKLNIKGIQNSIIQIGLALLLVAAAVKLIGGMEADELKQGFIGLAGVAIGMIVFIAAMGGISRYSGDVNGIGSMMKKLAIAMILMAVACKLIGTLSAEDMLKGAAFATGFGIFVIAITKFAKSAGNNVSKVGGMIIKLSIAMALMVGVCKLVGSLSAEEMIKGVAFAAAFVLFVRALVRSTKIGKKQQLAKLSGLVLSISFSLMMLVGVCKLVGMLSVGEMIKGAAFVAGFVILLKALISILKIGNEEKMAKIAGTILAMSVSIAILAGVAIVLSLIDLGGLAKGLIAVGLLSAMMTAMIKGLKGAQNVKGAIMMMAIAIAVMAASIVGLSFIDTKSLISAAGAMTIVMAAFASMIKSMKGIKNVKIGPLIVLVGVVAILAGIIALLSNVDPLSAISSALSLSLLLVVISEVFKSLSTINVKLTDALKIALSLAGVLAVLFGVAAILKYMSGVENAVDNALALSILIAVMTGTLAAASAIGAFLSAGIIAGLLGLLGVLVILAGVVGVLWLMSKVEDSLDNLKALTTFMEFMTKMLVVLAIVGPLALTGVAAMAGLTLLMGAIGIMAVAVGALMEKFPEIQKFLDSGLPVLEQLAGSIGTMVGKFISGIGEGLGDTLVKMGEDIAKFMKALSKASTNASEIKGDSFDGVRELMEVMAGIGFTTVGTTISDIFTLGGTSMEKFQTDGVAFFNAMKAIGEASSDVNIDTEAMNSIISVAQSLSNLQSSLEPIGGVVTWFAGRDDLGTFGVNAAAFVLSMKIAFSSLDGATFNTEAMDTIVSSATSLATLQSSLEPIGGVVSWFAGRDDLGTFGVNVSQYVSSMATAFSSLDGATFNTEAMSTIISASTELATLQSSLEPIGGVVTWFSGRDDLGTFGVNVAAFVLSMKIAFSSLDGVTFNTEAMDTIVSAATSLATLQSSLEPIGGVISWFTGRDDLGTFGEKVAAFIESMKTALSTLEGVTLDEVALQSVITAASKLAELQSTLEPMGGVVSWFSGRDDLGEFGTNIGLFAEGMQKLKTGMGEDGISEAVVTSVTNVGNAIIALQEALPEEGWFDGKMNLSEFSNYVTDFATAMSTFSEKATEIDSGAVTTAMSTAYRIKALITSLVDLDTSGVETFTGVGTGGFGADGPAYDIAQAMAAFSNKVSEIDTGKVSIAVTSAQRLKSLITSLVGLDTSGIENFKPVEIGNQIKSYSNKVSDINTATVSRSITSAIRLKNFIASLSGLDSSGIRNFKLSSIGLSIQNYGEAIGSVNIGKISSSIIAASQLKSFIDSLSSLNTDGIGSFKDAINQLSTVNIDNMVKAFSGASSKLQTSGSAMIGGLIQGIQSKMSSVITMINNIVTSMNKTMASQQAVFFRAGGLLASNLATGISSKKSNVNSAVSSCLSNSASRIRDKYSSFYNAGSYLVTGFCNGITANTWRAEARARAMANAAERAAREALDINSPSKVFKEIGSGIPEGFAMGIGMLGSSIKRSVTGMTSNAIDATRSTMSTILNAISADVDAQPTIHPVIDLSDVKSGVNSINGLFGGVQSIGVRSNLNAVNTLMNRRLQNGTNDDIISAINKLNDGLSSNRGDTYNFGDFIYDDDNSISEAVQTLIRAARMGRRV